MLQTFISASNGLVTKQTMGMNWEGIMVRYCGQYEVSATLFDICLPSFDYLCKQHVHVLTFCYNHLSFDFVNRDNIASSRKVSRRYQEGIIMNRSVDQDNRSGPCP